MSIVPTRAPRIGNGTSWRIREVEGGWEVVRRYPDSTVLRVFFAEDPNTAALHMAELNANLTDHAREINKDFE